MYKWFPLPHWCEGCLGHSESEDLCISACVRVRVHVHSRVHALNVCDLCVFQKMENTCMILLVLIGWTRRG